jgi:hypothetical protein
MGEREVKKMNMVDILSIQENRNFIPVEVTKRRGPR